MEIFELFIYFSFFNIINVFEVYKDNKGGITPYYLRVHAEAGKMLKHKIERRLNTNIENCRKCLLSPEKFLSESKYTYHLEKEGDTYSVIFRFKKLGITKYYRVRLKLIVDGNTYRLESLPDSEYPFNMKFTLEKIGEYETKVIVEAVMKADLMANLLGRKDFAVFVEDLVDKGISKLLMDLASGKKPTGGDVSCLTCLFYGSTTKYCYILKQNIMDPSNPPCNGKHYIRKK